MSSENQNSQPEKVKRKVSTARILKDLAPLVPHDEEGAQLLPNLWDLLLPIYDEKRVMERQPGRLFMNVDGWAFKCGILCPTERCVFTFESTCLVGILEQLESELAAGILKPKPMIDWKKRNLLPVIDELLK